jgi:hypothetical protein
VTDSGIVVVPAGYFKANATRAVPVSRPAAAPAELPRTKALA